jgi:hypothetical protein
MDNTLSFAVHSNGHTKTRIYLERVQKYSRSFVSALRTLDEAELRAVLAVDTAPYPELLEEAEIAGLMQRRDYAVRYIDDLIAQYGERDVLVFP